MDLQEMATYRQYQHALFECPNSIWGFSDDQEEDVGKQSRLWMCRRNVNAYILHYDLCDEFYV